MSTDTACSRPAALLTGIQTSLFVPETGLGLQLYSQLVPNANLSLALTLTLTL